MFTGIVAMTRTQRVMGKDNQLPWSLPGDLKFFKETTLGHRIIMGRKTFESIGSRPLPKRENWILSTSHVESPNPSNPLLRFYKSKEEIIEAVQLTCANSLEPSSNKKNFIIGGAKIFELFWPEISEMFVTWIEKDFDGDIIFPELKWDSFKTLSQRPVEEPIKHVFCHYSK